MKTLSTCPAQSPVRLDSLAESGWSHACRIASIFLDAPDPERNRILSEETGDDLTLREAVLRICANFSDSEDLFGADPLRAKALEDQRIGQEIGVWRVVGLIGEGGMGRVYLVERTDDVFARRAALKLTRGFCDAEAARRFRRERQILGRIDHEAVARALDGGVTSDGALYLVMEYVDGAPIDKYCQPLSIEEKVRVFLQVVEGIAAAHNSLVVHLDLKPSNILVTPAGQARILDFGIARPLNPESLAEHTSAGVQALTPAYASPEQLLGEPASPTSDIYALGAVLYVLLAGRPPNDLAGRNLLEIIRTVTEGQAPAPGKLAQIPPDLDCIVMKALAPDARRRYLTAGEFANDLRRFLDGRPVAARPATWRYRAGKFLRRNKFLALSTAAVTLALGAGGFISLREAAVAERRFGDVRGLALSVMLDYEAKLAHLPGSTRLREKIASDTVRYLDGMLPDAGRDRALRREIATAYRSVGEVQGYSQTPNLGKYAAAEESLGKSVSIWRSLVADHGADGNDRLQFATSLERLATVQAHLERREDAAASIGLSLDLLKKLPLGAIPASDLHRELSAAYVSASLLAQLRGEGAQAIAFAQKAVGETEQLTPQPLDPQGIAMVRLQLAVCYHDYSLTDRKLLAQAIEQARQAVKLGRKALPSCGETVCRETAAAILARAAVILGESGISRETFGYLRESIGILEPMLKEDPGNLRLIDSLRIDLGMQHSLLLEAGRPEDALRSDIRAREINEAIAESEPDRDELKLHLARSFSDSATTLTKLGRPVDARHYLDRALEICERGPTDNVNWLIQREATYEARAGIEQGAGDAAAAVRDLRSAVSAAENYMRRAPGHAYAMELDANSHYLLGMALRETDRTESCTMLDRGLQRYNQLIAMGSPIESDWKTNVEPALKAVAACHGLQILASRARK